MHNTEPTSVRIAPADLVHLYSECPRCFVQKVKHGVRRPGVFPDVYNVADRAMKAAFADAVEHPVDIGVGPRFRVIAQGFSVASATIPFPQHGISLRFEGSIDALVRTVDDEMFLVDYKTTNAQEGLTRYRRQLAAYAWALENPADPRIAPYVIDGFALLIYRPQKYAYRVSGVAGLYGRAEWLELPRRDDQFLGFLDGVAERLAQPRVPAASPDCMYCAYRAHTHDVKAS
jgi:hypothetical protein